MSDQQRSNKPFATSHEEPLEVPGLNVDVVVHHAEIEYSDAEFWTGAVDTFQGFVQLETAGRWNNTPTVKLEGRFNSADLLALYIALKQEEDK